MQNQTGSNLVHDLKAGFVVFLIALPLSIGIALASGAPAAAGLIAAFVGGMLGSFLGGSQLTINGPAAGLIVIVLGAVESLGQGNLAQGYKYMLAATVAAGVLQIVMGALRLANVGLAFPSSVVHGMLSAIGAIIIAKQFPVLFGVKAASHSIIGLFAEIPSEFLHLNPEVAYIGFTSLLLLIVWNKLPIKALRKIPAPLLVVLLGVGLGRYFDLEHRHTVQILGWSGEVNSKLLLSVPSSLKDSLAFPDFGRFWTLTNLSAVLSIAIIATIESTLSTFAVDKLDPLKRTSNLNRDLLSKGICNCVCGLIGGLPIISEIVRSSANIDNGARSKASNFFHGAMILTFLLLFPSLLHEIPLASLGAILIFVGWRLAHPSQFKHAFHIGPDHITAFCVTFGMTLATDLLMGVASGVVVEIVIALVHGVRGKGFFGLETHEMSDGKKAHVFVRSPAIFTNSLKLRAIVQKYQTQKIPVVLDLSGCSFIDHTVLDQVDRFRADFAAQGQSLELVLDNGHKALSAHPLASRKKAS